MTARGTAATAAVVLVAGALAACGPSPAGSRGDAQPAATPAASPAAAARPRIVVEPAAFDFGSARPGRTLDKDVTVRNHGDADLVIAKVDTTCNCTVVGAYATRIAPGSGTTLRVSLTTPQTPGRTEQAVRIESNDPDQPLAYVDVTATVVAEKTAAGRSR